MPLPPRSPARRSGARPPPPRRRERRRSVSRRPRGPTRARPRPVPATEPRADPSCLLRRAVPAQLLQLFLGVPVAGLELDRLLVVLDRQIFLTGRGIRVGEAGVG